MAADAIPGPLVIRTGPWIWICFFFGGLCRQTATLTLPHPRLAERLFVLAPLAEILPDWQHPLLRQSARELLERLEGGGQQVQKDRWPDPAP